MATQNSDEFFEAARDMIRGVESSGHSAIVYALLAQVHATNAQTDAIREQTAAFTATFGSIEMVGQRPGLISDPSSDGDAPFPAGGHPRGQLRAVTTEPPARAGIADLFGDPTQES